LTKRRLVWDQTTVTHRVHRLTTSEGWQRPDGFEPKSGSANDNGIQIGLVASPAPVAGYALPAGPDNDRNAFEERWSVARLDSRDSCGSVGSAEVLEVHAASGQQIVNASLEVT
jgi:hypothetical protein